MRDCCPFYAVAYIETNQAVRKLGSHVLIPPVAHHPGRDATSLQQSKICPIIKRIKKP